MTDYGGGTWTPVASASVDAGCSDVCPPPAIRRRLIKPDVEVALDTDNPADDGSKDVHFHFTSLRRATRQAAARYV
jgi:hypothetical protein